MEGPIAAHAVTALDYLNSKAVGARVAREATDALLDVFDVAGVDAPCCAHRSASDPARHRYALDSRWPDLEDAMTAAAARRAKCDAIVTRNPKDFAGSPVRVLTPSEAAAWITVG